MDKNTENKITQLEAACKEYQKMIAEISKQNYELKLQNEKQLKDKRAMSELLKMLKTQCVQVGLDLNSLKYHGTSVSMIIDSM